MTRTWLVTLLLAPLGCSGKCECGPAGTAAAQAAPPPAPGAALAPAPVPAAGPPAPGGAFFVDPEVGNNTLAAVFEAKLGERINAVSSSVRCELTYDEKTLAVAGACSVPLTSLKVDADDTKTEHFQQWATNKKSEPKDCKLEAKLDGVKLAQPLASETAVPFSADLPFSVCGRARADGGREHVTGAATYLPAGSYGEQATIKVRAKIEKWNRDSYHIGPKYTEGWLARVQSLAKVVAEEGTIELNLFAKAK